MSAVIPFFVLFFFGFVVLVIILAERQSKKAEEAWSTAARELGLQYTRAKKKDKKRELSGNYRGFRVRANTFVESNGNSQSTYTRYTATYPDLGLGLELKHQHFFGNLTRKLTGGKDYQTGDEHFDDAVIVKADSAEAARAFLTPARRRAIRFLLTSKRRATISDHASTYIETGAATSALIIQKSFDQLINVVETFFEGAGTPEPAPEPNAFSVVGPEAHVATEGGAEPGESELEREAAEMTAAGAALAGVLGERKAQLEEDDEPASTPPASTGPASEDKLPEPAGKPAAAMSLEELQAEAERIRAAAERAEAEQEAATSDWADATRREAEEIGAELEAASEPAEGELSPLDKAGAAASAPVLDPVLDPVHGTDSSKELAAPDTTAAAAESAQQPDASLAFDGLSNELFAGSLMSYQVKDRFNEAYAGRRASWSGKLERLTSFSSDLQFKGSGAKATIQMPPIQDGSFTKDVKCVVQITKEAEAALKGALGKQVAFEGELVHCDGFMRTLFLGEGTVRA